MDKDNKGHIDANDLRRVCLDMGYKVTEKDVQNMLMVMSPTVDQSEAVRRHSTSIVNTDSTVPPAISFERYKNTMQVTLLRD